MKILKSLAAALLCLLAFHCTDAQTKDWVTTWATALQIAEPHNNPPSPGLADNSFRQIVQVSIPGKELRLNLSNLFNTDPTEIKGVEIAVAKTMGESPEIFEETSTQLTLNGQKSFTMEPGQSVTLDPVKFKVGERMNLAITIHYGKISATRVTSHPGSRTTSYIAAGNTTDFSAPLAKTDHWYTISSIDVKPLRKSAAICVIGDSITDGRGTTTNGQNRWTDQLSRSLLQDKKTRNLSVLNFGLGGNCVLRGGLGPTAKDRYQRDLFGQSGARYVIIFEGTNDLGGSRDGKATAQGIIDVYAQIIREAHEKGMKVFGATVMPVKGNGYYSPDHEAGRQMLNEWIRNGGAFDGVIDFDLVTRDPSDPERLDPKHLYENDWLHANAAAYELMGFSIDHSLFR